MLLLPEVSPQQLQKGEEILQRARWNQWIGQNLIWGVTLQIIRGILQDNPDTISAGYTRMYQEIRISEGDGIQPDFSFHQHGSQLYSGGYGLDFADDVGRFIAYAWGTPWQVPSDKLDLFSSYVLDGEAWMIWDRTFDYSAVGRDIVRKGRSPFPRSWANGPIAPAGAAYSLLNVVTMLDQHPLPRLEEWQALESRLRLEPRRRRSSATGISGARTIWPIAG